MGRQTIAQDGSTSQRRIYLQCPTRTPTGQDYSDRQTLLTSAAYFGRPMGDRQGSTPIQDVRIDHRRDHIPMAKQLLDRPEVGAAFE